MQGIFDKERCATGQIWATPRQTGCFRFGSLHKKTNRVASRPANRVFPICLLKGKQTGKHPGLRGTRPISPLDIVAKCLKWRTLRRLSRLASSKMGHAGTTSLNVDWP